VVQGVSEELIDFMSESGSWLIPEHDDADIEVAQSGVALCPTFYAFVRVHKKTVTICAAVFSGVSIGALWYRKAKWSLPSFLWLWDYD